MTIKRTQAIADKILAQIAEGKSLRTICASKDMPSRQWVRRWLREDDDFCCQYARAREDQADHYVDEIIRISEEEEDVQRARLKIDSIKWIASKLKAKAYGDRVVNELVGKDGGPIQTEDVSAADRIRGRIAGLAARNAAQEDTE